VSRRGDRRALGLLFAALLGVTGCGHRRSDPQESAVPGDAGVAAVKVSPEEGWGIKAVSLRPSFGGTMLDFRYKVVDAEKARPLFDRQIKPYLFDPASGATLGMPEDTKLGALRASPRNPPVLGKQYYVLFSNGAGTVKKGSKVTVVIGDCVLENIVVN
jgi:hypothetical protein